jgi:carbamoyl-phosphate synthase large subunit
MKSTGEVMGRHRTFAGAYAKALTAAGSRLPRAGTVFLSIRDEDKAEILLIARGLRDLGFDLCGTSGTAKFLNSYDLKVQSINKVQEGSPHCVNAIQDGKFAFVINTASDETAIHDSFSLRRAALERKIPYVTVVSGARAMLQAIREERRGGLGVSPL